ncbi:MAG: cation-translocating P-type ATPase, partial [Elusimicrobia bacterium]|nr:cation-translocating P-type ATPase [Elusimicrobiota bacterium]
MARTPNRPWHSLTWEETARALETDAARGLTKDQVRRAAAAPALEADSPWRLAVSLFAAQWKGSVIVILTAAAVAFWFMGHRNDSIGIFASVIFSVVLGFITDFRSQRALAALKSLAAPTAAVLREGLVQEIPTGLVVRGDVVILRAGNTVPADGRLHELQGLSMQEAPLTGESAPRSKSTERTAEGAPLAERTNMAYTGTTVLTGSGRMIVTAVGLDTELGKIGKLVQSYEKEETPLERQVEDLGRRLALLVIALSVGVTIAGLASGQAFFEMLETGFLLAIAAIPEGLPAVYTVALAGGVRRMVRARALVRRLSAVEVLGSVDVICTDKTGTLTENVMRAAELSLPGRRIEITGSGYIPEGGFFIENREFSIEKDRNLQRLLWIGSLCNNAVLEPHDGWHIHGSPTEGALLTLAAQGGLDLEQLKGRHERLSESPFTSERKRMGVVVKDAGGRRWSLVKGAVGSVLPLCRAIDGETGEAPLSEQARAELRAETERLGAQGLRVLAFAYRELKTDAELAEAETGLVWVGMAGLLDPPRRGAAGSVLALRRAGVRTIMVTGDQKATALAIAKRIGLPGGEERCRDAKELNDILAREAHEELKQITVFARVAPEDKLKLVLALKRLGHVVAMTGDGINDAPALKAADIGIAMGSNSSDVAKEASDLVVTDADYSTVTAAVDEGRKIYANLRRAVRFLLLCSLANIGLMLGAVLLRMPLAMTALQILWLNLVVHIFPGIALAIAPNKRMFLEDQPRPRSAPLLSWREIGAIALKSTALSAAAFAVFAWFHAADLPLARTLGMTTLGVGLLLQVFPSLSD